MVAPRGRGRGSSADRAIEKEKAKEREFSHLHRTRFPQKVGWRRYTMAVCFLTFVGLWIFANYTFLKRIHGEEDHKEDYNQAPTEWPPKAWQPSPEDAEKLEKQEVPIAAEFAKVLGENVAHVLVRKMRDLAMMEYPECENPDQVLALSRRQAAKCLIYEALYKAVFDWREVPPLYPTWFPSCTTRSGEGSKKSLYPILPVDSQGVVVCTINDLVHTCVPEKLRGDSGPGCMSAQDSKVECEDGHVLCPGETAADTALYIQYTRGEFKRSRSYPKVGAELAAAASKNVKEDVRSAYLTLLKREPDPGGLASYAFELIRGHLKLEKMWVEMMESEEAREANGAEATKEELRARLELLGSLTKDCTSTAAEEKQQQTKGAPSSKKVVRHGRPLALGIGSVGDFSGGGDAKGGRWCRKGGGGAMPLSAYEHLSYAVAGVASPDQTTQTYPAPIPEAASAIRSVNDAFVEELGRYPSTQEMKGRARKMVWGMATEEGMRREFRNSNERKKAEKDGSKACAIAEQSKAWISFLGKVCPAGSKCGDNRRIRVPEEGPSNMREMADGWNHEGPLLINGKAASGNADWHSRKDLLPIAIYVNNRPEYFRKVISGLRNVKGISDTILLISMDSVHSSMLDIVASVDFCPLRLLIHPLPVRPLGRIGGRGVDGVLVIKRHWRWLLSQVFEQVPETRGREGDILLLEEDHMPTPDLLETMKRLLSIKNSGDCQGCWGAYSKFGCERQEQETDVHKACRVKWFVNTGLAFNASVYRSIKSSDFDQFRDGWDWSVYHLIQTSQLLECQRSDTPCTPHMVAPAVSRISNIGTEGVTVHESDKQSLDQLRFGTVGDDVYDKGYEPSKLNLAPYFGHGGPLDEPIFVGEGIQWLGSN